MAKMVKSILLATLALLLVSAAHAGLEETCKKTPDPAFCTTLLLPSAAEFADNDPAKMETAAVKAAVEKINAVKTLMQGPAAKGAKNAEVKEAIVECVDHVDRSPLTLSTRKLNNGTSDGTNARKAIPIEVVAMASQEMIMCHNALKRTEEAAKAAGGSDAEVTTQGMRAAQESALACSIVKAIIAP